MSTSNPTSFSSTPSWVVFSDQSPVWWAKLLKHGFRHCFMIQSTPDGWRVLDPFTKPPRMVALPFPPQFDLPGWLQSQGLLVIAATAPAQAPVRIPLWGRMGMLARALGLSSILVRTPWQLYCRLMQVQK